MDRAIKGEPISPKDARRLLPARDQYVTAWRVLEQFLPTPKTVTMPFLPLLRSISARIGRAEPFLCGTLCLAVFAERGL